MTEALPAAADHRYETTALGRPAGWRNPRLAYAWPFSILAAYMFVNLVVYSRRSVPLVGYETDGVYYMIAARSVFTSHFVVPTYGAGIGMPLMVRLVDTLVGDTFAAAKLISIAGGFVFLVAAMGAIRRLFSPSIAWISGALLLASPILLTYSATSMSDVLGAALPMLGIWTVAGERRNWRLVAAGLCLGLAYSVRFLDFVFWLVLLSPIVESWGSRRRVIQIALLEGAGLILGALPELWSNVVVYGNPLYTENWRNIALSIYSPQQVAQLHSFPQVLAHGWRRLIALWARRFTVDAPALLFQVVYWAVWFAVPGYMIETRRSKHRAMLALWGASVLLYLLLLAPIVRLEARYLLPVIPLVVACAVALWWRLTAFRPPILIAGVALLLFVTAANCVGELRSMSQGEAPELKQVGLTLRDRTRPGSVVLSAYPQIFFYAQHPGVLFESLSGQEEAHLETAMRARHIAWVAFDERTDNARFSRFHWLLDVRAVHTRFPQWSVAFRRHSPRVIVWHVY